MVEKTKEVLYSHQRKYVQCSSQESTEPGYVNIRELAEAMCRYDLDDVDLYWLNTLNRELDRMGKGQDHEGIKHRENQIYWTVESLSASSKIKIRALGFGLVMSWQSAGVFSDHVGFVFQGRKP